MRESSREKLNNLNNNLRRQQQKTEKSTIKKFTSNDRYALYEKLYFHELNRREHMVQRLNLPIAIIVGLLGFLSYLINNKPSPPPSFEAFVFWIFWCGSIASLLTGLWFFRTVWSGYKDEMLPTAESLEEYKKQCEETYRDFDGDNDVDQAMYGAMYQYFVKTASRLTKVNDKRSFNLFLVTICLSLSTLSGVVAYIPVFFHQQKASYDAETTTSTTTANQEREGQYRQAPPSSAASSPDEEVR